MTPFDYTDEEIAEYIKKEVRIFSKLRNSLSALKFDELNKAERSALIYVKKTYENLYDEYIPYLERIVKKNFKNVKTPKVNASDSEVKKFVKDFLETPDHVTKYIFNDETERKRARMFEALIAMMIAGKKDYRAELKVCMRLWTRQIQQTADDITMASLIESYKKAGVKKVVWHTQEDEKVCDECHELDKKVFDINNIPEIPQHYACRCYVTPYLP
jgi:SPP1 gp7 family putative phage head morphogenesis protein